MSARVPPRPDLLPDAGEAHRPTATWRWWEVVAFTLAGFLAGSIAGGLVLVAVGGEVRGRLGGAGLLAATVMAVVVVGVLVMWLRSAHPGWWRVVGWPGRGERLREAAVGVGLGILFQLGAAVFSQILVTVIGGLTGRDVKIPEQVSPGLRGWAAVAFFVYAVMAAPFTEELVFRGLLFRSIADRRGFWLGAIASAIPFGLIHVVPGAAALGVWILVFTMMCNGLAWAWIHWRRRNLLVNVALHATFNLIGVISILGRVGG